MSSPMKGPSNSDWPLLRLSLSGLTLWCSAPPVNMLVRKSSLEDQGFRFRATFILGSDADSASEHELGTVKS